jgi:hypothetical protein
MPDNGSPKQRPLPDVRGRNPFAAPTAHVEDARTPLDDTLADEPNRLGIGRGFAWWSGGWRLLREAVLLWIGIGVVLILISLGINLIPYVGGLVSSLVFPLFTAGLMLGCHALESGEELRFGHLFAGFQDNPGRLLAVGALYLLGLVIIVGIAFAFGFGGGFITAAAGNGGEDAAALWGMLLGGLVGVLLGLPLVMSVWFAPALVALHGLPAFEAMKLSFRGCLRNFLAFLTYGLAFIVLAIPATLLFGLGWLLLLPLTFCSLYASYRDIFTRERR